MLAKEVIIVAKYLDFIHVFLRKLAIKLFKCSIINIYLIDVELDKQLLYSPIYSSEFAKLQTFKTYIKTNLTNGFIQSFKSLAQVSILFI